MFFPDVAKFKIHPTSEMMIINWITSGWGLSKIGKLQTHTTMVVLVDPKVSRARDCKKLLLSELGRPLYIIKFTAPLLCTVT